MDCLFVESVCDLLKSDFLIKWIEILAIMAGGAFALYRWRSNALVKRSLKFHQLIKEIQNDKDVKKLLYTFDDDTKLWFLEEFVGDSAVAPALDKLLFHFSYVVYLRKKKIITKDEFATLSYEIDRSLQNPQLQDYLYNLKKYSEKRGLQHPYMYLVDYGIDKKILNKDSFASNYKKTKEELDWLKEPLTFHDYFTRWVNAEKEYRKSYNKKSTDESDGVVSENDKGM